MIHLAGTVSIEHGEAFEAVLLSMARTVEADAVLDLTGLGYINVIGMGVIVRLGNTLRLRGYRLALFGAAPNICKLLRTFHLHELFPPLPITSKTVPSTTQTLAICA